MNQARPGRTVAPWSSGALQVTIVAAIALLFATCSGERGADPLAPDEIPDTRPVALECTADVVRGTLGCAAPTATLPAGARGALTLGGQGVNVLLASTDVCFESQCDPDAPPGVFQADVTVTNLTGLALGTADGKTLHEAGVRVFFHTGPVAMATTDGQGGTAVVHNPDGTGTFTASDQPFFQYDEVLAPNAASAPKTWRWLLSPNVRSFHFSVLVTAEAAEPAPTEPYVVFDMLVGGNRDIYRVRLDGSDLERLTTSSADDRGPTAAGDVVVYTSYRDGNGELYALSLRAPDADPVRLTNTPAAERDAALSPDGSRLAYVNDASGLPRLWLAAANGGGAYPATTGHGHRGSIEAGPSWSPDGRRVAFVSTAVGSADIYILDVESGDIEPLAASPQADVEPTWSPGGDHVVFVSNRDGSARLYRVAVASGAVEALTTGPGPHGQPAYLPDGRIVFVAWESGAPELRWLDPSKPEVTHAIPLTAGTPANPAALIAPPRLLNHCGTGGRHIRVAPSFLSPAPGRAIGRSAGSSATRCPRGATCPSVPPAASR